MYIRYLLSQEGISQFFFFNVQKLYQPVVKPAEIRPQPWQGKDFVGRAAVLRKHCLAYWLAENV